MPYAVAHILVPILLIAIYRDFFAKNRFSLHYVLLAGLGGVLPDIDILISLFRGFIEGEKFWLHGPFTHSILFPLAFLVLFLIFQPVNLKARICNIGKHNLRLSYIFLSIGFGVLIHLLLDFIFGTGIGLFWPFLDLEIGLNLLQSSLYSWETIMITLDGVLLVLWILYLELKHKLSNFI